MSHASSIFAAKSTDKRNHIITCVLCVGLIVVARIVPHVPNIAPVAAVSLFMGTRFSRRSAIATPLIAMLISDALVGWYDWRLMISVYGSFATIAVLGYAIRKHVSTLTVVSSSIASSVLFFLTTNTAVWALSTWYPKTLDGLLACFSFALPFFRYSLVGDLFYTTAIFAIPHLATLMLKSLQTFKTKYASEQSRTP